MIIKYINIDKLKAVYDKYVNRKVYFADKDIGFICKYMSILISAGIRIDKSITMIQNKYSKKSYLKVLNQIENSVIRGDSLFDAVIKSDGKFPNIFLQMLEVSEKTGELDTVLNYLAEHFEEQEKYKKDIVMSLLYPIILLFVILVVFIILMKFVIPDFIIMFEDSGIDPPPITKITFSISQLISNNLLIIFLCLVSVILSIYYIFNKEKNKINVNRFLLKIPIFRNIIINTNTVQFTKSIHIMFSSGIGLQEAIHISYQNTKNPIYKNEYRDIVKSLSEGNSLSSSIENLDIFPEIFKMLIYIGEESGELEESFKLSYEFIYEELSNSLNRILKLSEPILIIIVALMVVGIILTVFIPIMSMYDGF